MKKLTTLIFALFVINIGFSQNSLGLKVGYTSSNLSNRGELPSTELKRGYGLLVGVMRQFGINDKISVITELNLQQKGVIISGSIPSNDFKSQSIISYLEVPILLKYSIGENLKFFGSVGPYLGYAITAKSKNIVTVNDETMTTKTRIKFGVMPGNYTGKNGYLNKTFNQLEIGLYVGTGIQKRLGTGSLILDARFGIGLTDINNTGELYPNGKPDDYKPNKFNNISISIGYLFPFGGN
ncbi:MAG: porin family protein [Saprospiraceae bacterium]